MPNPNTLVVTREKSKAVIRFNVGEMAQNIMDLVLQAESIHYIQVQREKGEDGIAGIISQHIRGAIEKSWQDVRDEIGDQAPPKPEFRELAS